MCERVVPSVTPKTDRCVFLSIGKKLENLNYCNYSKKKGEKRKPGGKKLSVTHVVSRVPCVCGTCDPVTRIPMDPKVSSVCVVSIISVTMTSSGSGYTLAPTMSFTREGTFPSGDLDPEGKVFDDSILL